MVNKDLYFLFLQNKIKIGISQDVEYRINRILTSGGYRKSDILKLIELKSKGYLEIIIHRKLKEFRINGEWFERTNVINIFLHRLEQMSRYKLLTSQDIDDAFHFSKLINHSKTIASTYKGLKRKRLITDARNIIKSLN